MSTWRGYELTDPPMTDPDVSRRDPSWHAVTLIREKLTRKYGWARDMGVTEGNAYDEITADAIAEFQARAGIPVLLDDDGHGIADYRTRVRLGSYPPPPGPRHLALLFRGTGGIIGADYTDLAVAPSSDLVEVVHPVWAATMGGIPVGTAGSLGDLSMAAAVDIAVTDAQRIITEALDANPARKIILGGYSAGAVAAARVRQWLHDTHPDNYLCSFSLGDPTRPAGGCYYRGTPAPGRGISSWRYGDPTDYRHAWLAAPGDMYTSIPDGLTGDIMDDCYDVITQVQLSDPLGTAQAIIKQIPATAEKVTGQPLPETFAALMAGPAAWIGLGLPMLISSLTSLITGPDYSGNLPGPAAAAQAAVIALRFVADNPPTRAHITYEWQEVWPGQSFLGLAQQHVRDHASRVEPIDAAA